MTKETEFIPFMGVVEFDENTKVNETLTNTKGNKVKKKIDATKILNYVKKHPLAKAKEVAQALGVPVNRVYQTTYHAKKKASGRVVASVLAPNALRSLALFSDSPKKEVKDNVNHPPHYKTGGIETIDFIEAKSLSYNLGNVVKYITRADHKGNMLEDLKKAQWYLNREVSNLTK